RLAESARDLLARLGYTNVEIHLAGETLGWPEGAPYEAIVVTAGAPRLPSELVEQLAQGGRLVVPVGSRYDQDLVKAVKVGEKVITESLGGCRFVPLVGKGAWSEEKASTGDGSLFW
ncbi:MAG: protein-L-isoaspartate O-methyltransferase, partial [Chloroflexota bacterium]|nr:protein-L-isoaspartate O-methyltransferase [Chloroflexota bacterium]